MPEECAECGSVIAEDPDKSAGEREPSETDPDICIACAVRLRL